MSRKLPYKRTHIGDYMKPGAVVEVLNIIDGDTFDVKAFIDLRDINGCRLPKDIGEEPIGIDAIINCRLYGLDTREKNDPLHHKIVDHIKNLLHRSSNRVIVNEIMTARDKWGRTLVKISVRDQNEEIIDLTEYLLNLTIDGKKVANEYYGGTKLPFED